MLLGCCCGSIWDSRKPHGEGGGVWPDIQYVGRASRIRVSCGSMIRQLLDGLVPPCCVESHVPPFRWCPFLPARCASLEASADCMVDGVCVCVERGGGCSSHRSACECVFDTHAAGKADLEACFDENECLCVYKLEQEPAVGRQLPWTKNEQTKAFSLSLSLFGVVVVLSSKIGGRG